MNSEINVLPIRLCFINVYTDPNPKPTPYNNEKNVFQLCSIMNNNYCCTVCQKLHRTDVHTYVS